jgi:hypothetical protein
MVDAGIVQSVLFNLMILIANNSRIIYTHAIKVREIALLVLT